MENEQYTKKIMDEITNNQLDQANELFYYYRQGFDMGKEETQVEIAHKLANIGLKDQVIAQVVNIPLKMIRQIIR